MNQDFTDTIFSLKYHENDEHSIALKGAMILTLVIGWAWQLTQLGESIKIGGCRSMEPGILLMAISKV